MKDILVEVCGAPERPTNLLSGALQQAKIGYEAQVPTIGFAKKIGRRTEARWLWDFAQDALRDQIFNMFLSVPHHMVGEGFTGSSFGHGWLDIFKGYFNQCNISHL